MKPIFKKTIGFQIGTIFSLVLLILLVSVITLNLVSSRYDRQVLADKQEKLKVTSQGLSRGLAGFLDMGQSPRELKGYFENQGEVIINANPRIIVGLYLPEMGYNLIYGEMSGDNRFLFFRPKAGEGEGNRFFGMKISTIKESKTFVKDGSAGIFVGRAQPITAGERVRGVVLIAEHIQESPNMVRHIIRFLMFILPICWIVGTIATVWVLARLKWRVRQITSGLAIIEKDTSYRLPLTPGDELGDISTAINKMAEVVEQKLVLEEQLERSHRLAALGRLVAGVAHEIRNPLGIIKATVQVMQDEFSQQPPMQEYLAVLNEQVERQNKIIRELLDYAKPVPPIFQSANINEVLNSVLGFSKAYFQQHRVSLALQTSPQLPLVNVDIEKFKQVFLNLIFNAVESMPASGELAIQSTYQDNQVIISFTDNGRGIPAGDLPNLFEPFFSTKNTGTGLGLAMIHKVVEMHRGEIEVSSKLGEGTVFQIKLPVEQREG
ncbi:MAG: ATP-binding protein [Carboxydocellales bacterium]